MMKRLITALLLVCILFPGFTYAQEEDTEAYDFRVMFYYNGTLDEMGEMAEFIMQVWETPVAVQPVGEGYQEHHIVFCTSSETCYTLQGDIEIVAVEEVSEKI